MKSKEIKVVGIDLGGTNIEAALVSGDGEIQKRIKQKTKLHDGTSAVEEQIVALIEELRGGADGEQVAGVGIGVAGQVEGATGKVWRAPNLEWRDVPLQSDLQSRLEVPVVVLNDVRAATRGEWQFGAGQGCDDLLCMFVGTGVGGGVVCGGRMLEGSSNAAGELGHVIVKLNGPACSCGNRGCLESLAGGWAIAHQARENIASDPVAGHKLRQLAEGQIGNVSARTVAQAFDEGDPLAGRIVDEVAQALGAGMTGLVHAFNPRRIILGGGVIEGLPVLLERVRMQVQEHAFHIATKSLEMTTAKLGDAAGVVGAAAKAHQISAPEKAAPVISDV